MKEKKRRKEEGERKPHFFVDTSENEGRWLKFEEG